MTVAAFVAAGAPELTDAHQRMRQLESALASSAGAGAATCSTGDLHHDLLPDDLVRHELVQYD
ncbi:hypothetical protein [Segeticoccus rhizosphaerae]|jgi:hypothetical protein|uniref:hypothetical protein n=1 Tax=Segeticoccus rhizosphaerae TaxID=1104777 RepID=UPI0010C0D288|nr:MULTISPECIES: hypothetical protein [Intrasporangiaceae]